MKVRMVAPALVALAVMVAAGSAEAQRPKAKRLAVIVGIDNYTNAAAPLKGAENDAKLTNSMLIERGYAPIIMLTNQEANAGQIRKALQTLVKAAGPNDHVYFHFSGYANKEASGPALCGADYMSNNGIPYREIKATFNSIRSKKKTAVIDCSFVAGAPTRTTTVRYWPGTRGSRGIVGPSLNRPAVETFVKVGRDSKWLGALTWTFVRSMQTSAPRTTVKQLDGAMNSRSAGKFAQKIRARDFAIVADTTPVADPQAGVAAVGDGTPQADQVAEVVPDAGQALETAAEKVDNAIEAQPTADAENATFEAVATGEQVPGAAPDAATLTQQVDQGASQEAANPQPNPATDNTGQAISVDSTMGTQVTLTDGASADLTPGTVLQADQNNDGKPEATVTVQDVGIDTATAVVTQGAVQDNTQLEVTQTAPNPADDRLAVEIAMVGMVDVAAVTAALQQKAFLRLVGPGETPERRLAVGMGGEGIQAKLLPVDVAPDTQNIADGQSAADAAALVTKVHPQLVSNFLFKRMSLLNNPRSSVSVNVTANGPGGSNAVEGVKLGDAITFTVTVDKPAFVTLLAAGAGGSLNVLLPNDLFKGDQKAQPGTPYMVPPPNGGFQLTATAPAGPTMVIAIVTSKPFDISSLNVQTIPSLRGIGQVRNPEIRGRNIRDIVAAQAGGESEADEWGSAFIVVPINP